MQLIWKSKRYSRQVLQLRKQLATIPSAYPLPILVGIMKPARLGGKPDFLVGAVTVDDDLRTIVKLQLQHRAVEVAFDIRTAGVYGLLDAVKHCIGQFVEFVFRHIIPYVRFR